MRSVQIFGLLAVASLLIPAGEASAQRRDSGDRGIGGVDRSNKAIGSGFSQHRTTYGTGGVISRRADRGDATGGRGSDTGRSARGTTRGGQTYGYSMDGTYSRDAIDRAYGNGVNGDEIGVAENGVDQGRTARGELDQRADRSRQRSTDQFIQRETVQPGQTRLDRQVQPGAGQGATGQQATGQVSRSAVPNLYGYSFGGEQVNPRAGYGEYDGRYSRPGVSQYGQGTNAWRDSTRNAYGYSGNYRYDQGRQGQAGTGEYWTGRNRDVEIRRDNIYGYGGTQYGSSATGQYRYDPRDGGTSRSYGTYGYGQGQRYGQDEYFRGTDRYGRGDAYGTGQYRGDWDRGDRYGTYRGEQYSTYGYGGTQYDQRDSGRYGTGRYGSDSSRGAWDRRDARDTPRSYRDDRDGYRAYGYDDDRFDYREYRQGGAGRDFDYSGYEFDYDFDD